MVSSRLAQELPAILEEIYSSAEDPANWPCALERMADILGSTSGLLISMDPRNQLANLGATSQRVSPESIFEYHAHWATRDPWFLQGFPLNPGARQTPWPPAVRAAWHPGHVSDGRALISDAALSRTDFYNEFAANFGHFQPLFSPLTLEPDLAVTISFHFPRDFGECTPDQHRALKILVPHLQRALSLHRHIPARDLKETAFQSLLDDLPIGVVLVDERGRSLYLNREAERIVRENDGLRQRRGDLDMTADVASFDFTEVMKRATRTSLGRGSSSGGVIAISRPSGKPPYQLEISPVSCVGRVFSTCRSAAVVMIKDPTRLLRPSYKALKDFFGLTEAESRIACDLAIGRSTKEIAQQRAISSNTLRTHLKRIYVKTDASGQAALVSLLLQGMALGWKPTQQ